MSDACEYVHVISSDSQCVLVNVPSGLDPAPAQGQASGRVGSARKHTRRKAAAERSAALKSSEAATGAASGSAGSQQPAKKRKKKKKAAGSSKGATGSKAG